MKLSLNVTTKLRKFSSMKVKVADICMTDDLLLGDVRIEKQ